MKTMMLGGRLMKLLKGASLLTVGVGFGYIGGKAGLIYNPFYTRDEKICYQFEAISKEHQDFLKTNDFTEPHYFYDILERRKQTNTFFEKALLSDLKAFQLLDFFVTKDMYNTITEKNQPTNDIKETEQDDSAVPKKASLACVFRANDNAQGHFGIIHGGLTATLIDSMFGAFSFMLNDLKPVATTNLQVVYKKPLKVGKEYMLVCELEHHEGKHFFLKSIIRDPKGHVFCESTARFTKVEWGAAAFKMLFGSSKGKSLRETLPDAQAVLPVQPIHIENASKMTLATQ